MKRSTYYTLLFPLAAYIVLMSQSDFLYAVEENNTFLGNHTFMLETLRQDGGLWAWTGSFLTQFFHYPWLGSLLLVAIWSAAYLLIVDSFALKGNDRLLAWIPICALLISVTDVGYWIYYINMPGYWFSQSVSFLAAMLITWIAGKIISRFSKQNIAWMLFIFAYFSVRQKFPEFEWKNYGNHALQIPFIIAPLSVVLLPLAKFIIVPIRSKWKNEVLTLVALCAFAGSACFFSFRDYNFHAELRMMRAIDSCRWDKVIDEAKKAKRPTNLMVIYKNIALLHQGRITDMFKINNCGVQPQTGDSLQVYITRVDASMIYYQLGQINYAYRWAMEKSVTTGFSVKNLKMMVRCAIMNHEFELGAKYIGLLKTTLFHKDWAKEREAMLTNANRLRQTEEYKCIAPLLTDAANTLGIDDSMPERWLLDHFSEHAIASNTTLEDLILCASLWTEDTYSFCMNFYRYAATHQGEKIPELYQQAALLLSKQPDSPIDVTNFPFDDMIVARYNHFCEEYNVMLNQGTKEHEMGDKLKRAYGDTYWWYYYFYTDFIIY